MAAIGEYIFSVSATALICGIITNLMKNSSGARPLKIVCNLILLTAVLSPVANLGKYTMSEFSFASLPDGACLIEEGALASRNEAADIIKRQCEAYILDKAAAMGLSVTVEVTLSSDDPPVPVCVEIIGGVSPYLKLRLEEMIQEDLNVAKENQLWTG